MPALKCDSYSHKANSIYINLFIESVKFFTETKKIQKVTGTIFFFKKWYF